MAYQESSANEFDTDGSGFIAGIGSFQYTAGTIGEDACVIAKGEFFAKLKNLAELKSIIKSSLQMII